MLKTTLVTTLATAMMLGPLPAAAQPGPGAHTVVPVQFGQGRAVERGRFQQVYAQGYQAGAREGERDARGRRGRDYGRHNDYRRGGGWGNSRSAEAEAFRRGFADGYGEAYSRYDRGRNDRYPQRGYPSYPTYPSYPGQGYPDRGYPGQGYYSPAAQRGFDDGYREGRDAGRDNDRYDPVREKRYREGDNGYNRRYGSREQYKQEYRDGFRQGYDRGYREARYR